MRRVIREGTILIINLERGGVLRDEDVQIFANLFLHEILFAVFSMPRHERVPYFLILDELPDFQSCAPLLAAGAATHRKYKLRLVGAHQGTQFFGERTQDRLLHALVAQCRLHYYFQHADPVDAKFFGEVIKLPLLDGRRVKHVLRQQQQYQDGHDRIVLEDEGESWTDSDTAGTAATHGTANTSTEATGASDAIREAVGAAAAAAHQTISANTNSHADSRGANESATTNRSHTAARGGSRTRRTTLVPRIKTRLVITGVQFMSIDEQNVEGAVELSRLPVGTAIEYRSGKPYPKGTIPVGGKPSPSHPKVCQEETGRVRRGIGGPPRVRQPGRSPRRAIGSAPSFCSNYKVFQVDGRCD